MSKVTYYHIAGGELVEGTALGRITIVIGAHFDTLAAAYVRAGEREHALRVELHAAKQKLAERDELICDVLEAFKLEPDGSCINPGRDFIRPWAEKVAALSASAEPVCKRCGNSGVIDDKDKDELPSGHYVEKGLVSCPECEELRAPLAKPDPNTDVRTILLDVVPGDGDGREVYATCCDDIVTMLSDQADRIEELEAAQHQGEPVAVMYADGSVLTKAECGIAFETCCNVETPLYTK